MVEPTVKRKPPKVLDIMSNEDWDLSVYFVRVLTLKKLRKSGFFFLF